MKIYKILDEDNDILIGTLLYFEKQKDFIIELPEYLDEWTAPLLFSSFAKEKIYTIPREISFLWVKERVIPSGRQNISDILNRHHLKSYDEMKFLEISEGKCSQDSLYIKKTDQLPDYVQKRQTHTLRECLLLDDYQLLCFFADDTTRKIPLKSLKNVDDLEKILSNEKVYQTGRIGSGGYCLTFNLSIDIPAWLLYQSGTEIPLSLKDFKSFLQNNILDTAECCDILECSRQNVAYLVKQGQLTPVKKEVRGNLYLKGEVLLNS
jgi:hypothetical protein